MKNKYEIRGETTAIYLPQKNDKPLETIIDTTDLQLVDSFPYSWYAKKERKIIYVSGAIWNGTKQTQILMHRLLMNPPGGLVVDHINRNPLDNRRANLRVVTQGENSKNKSIGYLPRTNTSGVSGVYWHKGKHKWAAQVIYKKKMHFLGYFAHIDEAADTVKSYRLELTGSEG